MGSEADNWLSNNPARRADWENRGILPHSSYMDQRVCPCCGNDSFAYRVVDSIDHIVCEEGEYCHSCGVIAGYSAYGNTEDFTLTRRDFHSRPDLRLVPTEYSYHPHDKRRLKHRAHAPTDDSVHPWEET